MDKVDQKKWKVNISPSNLIGVLMVFYKYLKKCVYLLSVTFFLLLSGASLAFDEGEFKYMEHVYGRLLLSDTDLNYTLLARGLIDDRVQNVVLYDLLAESLAVNKIDEVMSLDAYRWVLKALSKSKDAGRYREFIRASVKGTKRKGFLNVYTTVKQSFRRDTEEKFVPGRLDRESLKKHLGRMHAENYAKENLAAISKMDRRTSVSDLISLIGYPDRIRFAKTISGKIYFIGRVELNQIVFEYDGFGTVMLTRGRNVGWRYMRSLPIVSVPIFREGDTEKKTRFMEKVYGGLWSWDRRMLTLTARAIRREYSKDQEMLDQVLLRIWWGRYDTEAFTDDGLAQLAELFLLDKSPRYNKAMGVIVGTGVSSKVRSRAKKFLRKQHKASEEEFIPSHDMIKLR